MAIAKSKSWEKIFIDTGAINHNFSKGSFELTASDIKKACQPKKIAVTGDFNPRGGIKTEVSCKE